MKARKYLRDKRERKSKPLSSASAMEQGLEAMGLTAAQARELRLECDDLVREGMSLGELNKHVTKRIKALKATKREPLPAHSPIQMVGKDALAEKYPEVAEGLTLGKW